MLRFIPATFENKQPACSVCPGVMARFRLPVVRFMRTRRDGLACLSLEHGGKQLEDMT